MYVVNVIGYGIIMLIVIICLLNFENQIKKAKIKTESIKINEKDKN